MIYDGGQKRDDDENRSCLTKTKPKDQAAPLYKVMLFETMDFHPDGVCGDRS